MSDQSPVAQSRLPQLLLLRHGKITSHRGDASLTDEGRAQARQAGRLIGEAYIGTIVVAASPTARTRETADELRDAIAAVQGLGLKAPREAFALRNPDLYLAGGRVEMVSSAESFAEQIPGMTASQCLGVPFFAGFLASDDRIGWWLNSDRPPGDDAAAVAARISGFARSLGDAPVLWAATVIGVTHSPVLRAVALALLGYDPGEPDYLDGFLVSISEDGTVTARSFSPGVPQAFDQGRW